MSLRDQDHLYYKNGIVCGEASRWLTRQALCGQRRCIKRATTGCRPSSRPWGDGPAPAGHLGPTSSSCEDHGEPITVPLANMVQRSLSLVCSPPCREGCLGCLESWVGILPCIVRAFGCVNSLEPLVGTRAILMRIWRKLARGERALKAEHNFLGVEAILPLQSDRRETALVSRWIHALALSCKLQDLPMPQLLRLQNSHSEMRPSNGVSIGAMTQTLRQGDSCQARLCRLHTLQQQCVSFSSLNVLPAWLWGWPPAL